MHYVEIISRYNLTNNTMITEQDENLVKQAWAHVETFPPVNFLVAVGHTFVDFLLDRAVMALIAFFSGAGCLLLVQALILWRIYRSTPPAPPPDFPTSGSTDVRLPQVLKHRLGEDIQSKKEDGTWFNFLLQFMFSELKDSLQLRRFLTKKIQTEFEEILRSRSGILVDELFLRDFNLGDNFPVFTGISVDRSDVVRNVIQTLDIKGRVMYDGGFQIAVDAALPFGRVAFVSVKVLKVRGLIRFRFTRHPFSHWCMSFYEEPEIDLDISAQLDGRPMQRLKGIFASQIRRIIRKKHTLPMYKIRFKPFFPPRPDLDRGFGQRIKVDGTDVGQGIFEVTVKGASRLRFVPKGAYFYCTVSVDKLQWKQKVADERKRREIVTVQLTKNSADQSLGMTVKDEVLPDRLHPVVVIEGIIVGMPAHLAQLRDGEILVAVSGNKVYSAKEASKSLKWTKENKIEIQIERRDYKVRKNVQDDLPLNKKTSEGPNRSPTKMVTHSLPPSAESSHANVKANSSLTNNSRKTLSKPACENPRWDQKFIFTVDPSLHFLNICLWSKGGDYSGSSELLKSAKHDVLVGYASLSLKDIYLHCLITLNGSLCDRVKLKHGHYKTETELIKEWSVHKGWDPTQMYGDLSLGMHFHPTQLTPAQRQGLASCRSSSASRLLLQDNISSQTTKDGRASSSDGGSISTEEGQHSLNLGVLSDGRRDIEGHHQFDSTTFINATFCDYCGRKIWMKEAFKCRTCSMVCHKKCVAKCLVNTVCTKSGVRKKDAEDEAWKPPQTSARPVGTNVKVDMNDPREGSSSTKDEEMDDDSDEFKVEDQISNQNLSNMLAEVIFTPDQEMGSQVKARTESSPETSQHVRFRALKEQTDRMKENVLRHMRRSKASSAPNDKAILAAKLAGAQLHADMDPLLRKDKLEEMVRQLDEQLVIEIQQKEQHEQQLEKISKIQGHSSAEVKALQQKIVKSSEKQEAMRLLMLQYCAGLQSCIKSLEADAGIVDTSDSRTASPNPGPAVGSPQQERRKNTFVGMSQGVGGFVRRASSSVKEKMSSIKDFGRKGGGSKTSSPVKSISMRNDAGLDESERNNSGLVSMSDAAGDGVVRNARSKSDGQVEHLKTSDSLGRPTLLVDDIVAVVAAAASGSDGVGGRNGADDVLSPLAAILNQPAVQIHVDQVDSPIIEAPLIDQDGRERERTNSGEMLYKKRNQSYILRSRSDSYLDMRTGEAAKIPVNSATTSSDIMHSDQKYISKGRQSLSPGDILSYGGSSKSLPPQLFHNDSDSDCSDYVLIESSDDDNIVQRRGVSISDVSSSSDYDDDDDDDNDDDFGVDNVTEVAFEGEAPLVESAKQNVGMLKEEDEDIAEEHDTILQHLQTYQYET